MLVILLYQVLLLRELARGKTNFFVFLEQATFDLDSTVQYHCHLGYSTAGFPRAKCLAIDGQASWYGPDISCERKQFCHIW